MLEVSYHKRHDAHKRGESVDECPVVAGVLVSLVVDEAEEEGSANQLAEKKERWLNRVASSSWPMKLIFSYLD